MSPTGKVSDGDPASARPTDEAALERERWLRDRFEKEHHVTLAMMRLLVAGVRNEGPAMRFWRWLIDDVRSERRLLESPDGDGWNDRVLRGRLRSWFTKRGSTPDRDSKGRGFSERSI